MFFLLAAFMLVSLSMTHLRRVPIHLPEASTGVAGHQDPAISDRHRRPWRHHLGGQDRHPLGNHRRLKAAAAPAESRVLISADADARHGQVLAVLNAVRDAGVEKSALKPS